MYDESAGALGDSPCHLAEGSRWSPWSRGRVPYHSLAGVPTGAFMRGERLMCTSLHDPMWANCRPSGLGWRCRIVRDRYGIFPHAYLPDYLLRLNLGKQDCGELPPQQTTTPTGTATTTTTTKEVHMVPRTTAAQSGASPNPELLTCELCSKSHQRRDLLIRHRRRCQGPTKPQNRRKACDACVCAKTRCDYAQPICARCARRNTPCIYASSSTPDTNATTSSTTSNHSSVEDSAVDLFQSSEMSDMPSSSTATSDSLNSFSLTTTADSMDLSLWDTNMTSSWPLDAFEVTVSTAMPSAASLPGFDTNASTDSTSATDLPMSTDICFPQSGATSWNLPLFAHMASSHNLSTPTKSIPPPSTSLDAVRILGEYPAKLLSEELVAPFLHRTLYSDAVPDMTSLPWTSMAICCGSGLDSKNSKRFVRRAIDAARQRLIEAFPSYECMQQWDALHAMLLYEVLELRESLGDELETWKHGPRVKGLRSPFLLKMTHCYARSYPAIRNPDIDVFSDPGSAPTSTIASSWARWRITETARRTVFFANTLNFYINHNHVTGEQLPYYEPLDDDLILNMPLPCSEAAWNARDEPSWMMSMQTNPSPLVLDLAIEMGPSNGPLQEVTLKTMFSRYNREYIQQKFGRNVGFSDSDKRRALILLCACEQFC
ncbi:hypothetical protein T440DRAFT_504873 [Plenodomus tracheiphilus IPT5]|uniref:Zn(2)-C6 fungal-type domain-containing protein n=1 Tax=Plenodomus tracheiphilus IPT5 TaxID=1408161 RepID=A0A6A7BJH2_9PLEO|nr:hypothetical protein T440DRAFT_504873 [Plenodomus tracheiphilus IPT5]